MKSKEKILFLSVSLFPLKSCYFFITFLCISLFSINFELTAKSKQHKTYTNYGKLYVDFLESKSTSFLNREDSAHSSQVVFSLVPNRYEYENSHGQCKQLCIMSTDLFLTSPSLKIYAELFINNLKLMINKMGLPVNLLHYDTSFEAQKAIMDKYIHRSKFIRSDEISKEIMTLALSLDDSQKASVIFVIGGHAINVNLLSKNGYVDFFFYEPYLGQIYKQSVRVNELPEALAGRLIFEHPYSILNQNNVLLGRVALFDTSVLDPSIPISFMEVIQSKNDSEINKESDISFSDNVSFDEVIEYLALTPNMFDIILYVTKKSAFNNFLIRHKDKIIKKISSVTKCSNLISNCNYYLREILSENYQRVNEIVDKIKALYSRQNERKALQTVNYFDLLRNEGNICVKKLDSLDNVFSDVKKFFHILYDDKHALAEALKKCVREIGSQDKERVAKKICKDFRNVDPNAFSQANNGFYQYIDAKRKWTDICEGFGNSLDSFRYHGDDEL